MFHYLFLLMYIIIIEANHFNGGTIRWEPIDPYSNGSVIDISIIQSYSWSYPTISCADNVPISTSGRSSQNANLTCVVDCSTDGGYSAAPVDILTNCTSTSASLGMMTSERSVNITLLAGAHFYLAHVGSAWTALNDPPQSGLEWSIVTSIDIRLRPDGFINTPPVTSVVSPQYAIVNETLEINIPVWDKNAGDDVRCRWSTYTPGYRRRKRSASEVYTNGEYIVELDNTIMKSGDLIHIRKKRGSCSGCTTKCALGCDCGCNGCTSTTCTGSKCTNSGGCTSGTTTFKTTTLETPGILESTSSYPNRQAIDECGGICYPGSVPYGTTLSGCTVSFTGLIPDTWYAVAIQVEDFIDSTSTTPLSSVPVQFLIYVLPAPACSAKPIILSFEGCLEVTVGVSNSFNLSVLNLCDPADAEIIDIIVSTGITGMHMSNLAISSTNASIFYKIFTWTPQANQLGSQQLCVVAFTTEKVQSTQYCVTFTVQTSSNVCGTTTSVMSVTSTGAASSTLANIVSAVRTVATTTSMSEDSSGKKLYWGLIAGLSSLGILLIFLIFCCCYLCCYWYPAAKHSRPEDDDEEEEEQNDLWQERYPSPSKESVSQISPYANQFIPIQVPRHSYQVYPVIFTTNHTNTPYIMNNNYQNASTVPQGSFYTVPVTIPNYPFQHVPVVVSKNPRH